MFYHEARAHLEKQKEIFDLTQDGLGDDLLDITATGVIGHFLAQSTPEGTRWAALSEAYAKAKGRIAPGQPIGVLYDLMSQESQITGERSVTKKEAKMIYGIDPQAKEEAAMFIEGNANQPGRNFWGFSRHTIGNLKERLTRRLEGKD